MLCYQDGGFGLAASTPGHGPDHHEQNGLILPVFCSTNNVHEGTIVTIEQLDSHNSFFLFI